MPILTYVDNEGYLCDFEVCTPTRASFNTQGLVSAFRSIHDLTLWLSDFGLAEEFRQASALANAQLFQNFTSLNNERNDKMTLSKEQTKILSLLHYFGPMTRVNLKDRLKRFDINLDEGEFDNVITKLRYDFGYIRVNAKANTYYYSATNEYGSY
jgi:hypothetical protein